MTTGDDDLHSDRHDSVPGGPDGHDAGASDRFATRRLVLVLAAACVLVAVSVVVLTDDVRWLRVGVVAALWASLAAVWTLVQRSAEPDSESLRHTYELELAAEIDARRAHEHTVEQTVRRELEAERGGEIEALRAELERLRGVLEQRPTEAVSVRGTRLHVVGGSTVDASTVGASTVGQGGDAADVRTVGLPTASPASPSRPAGPPDAQRPAARGRTSDGWSPGASAPSGSAASSRGPGMAGRTVAELLAAHAAATSEGSAAGNGRRRRDR